MRGLVFRLPLLATLAGGCAAALAAAPLLYETGPAQDSAFVRFVNGTGQKLDVVAGKARLALTTDKPVSDFQSVKPNIDIKGDFEGAGVRSPIAVKTAPGAFATVVALVPAGQKAVTTTVLSETPDDFNALKASIAFYNVDAACKGAAVQVAGRNVALFTGVAQGSSQRRAINPVQVGVQLMCDGKPRGNAIDLGTLQAGQRYSLVLVPSAATGSRLIFATDDVAR
ncbi:alginate O-acetyltransferase AlgF [Xylophilus sp. GW821-FHT01B05]